MADKIEGVDPNILNPNHPNKVEAPVDPSNTSSIGQKVEQRVIEIKEGISEQSNEWEDQEERKVPDRNQLNKAETYLKDPSPEENNTEEEQ